MDTTDRRYKMEDIFYLINLRMFSTLQLFRIGSHNQEASKGEKYFFKKM